MNIPDSGIEAFGVESEKKLSLRIREISARPEASRQAVKSTASR